MSVPGRILVAFLFLMAPLVGAEAPEQRMETQLFIKGQTLETGEPYGAATEEADLRGLLTKLGVAAYIVLEKKPDSAVTNMSLLRQAEEGKIVLGNLHFIEVMHLSWSWNMAKPGQIDQDLVRAQIYGFMEATKAYIASTRAK